MKTSTIQVGELISSLSTLGADEKLSTLPGINQFNVNFVSESNTLIAEPAWSLPITAWQAARKKVANMVSHIIRME